MKRLLDCKKGCRAKIIKLHATTDLKQRLISFGIMKDATIEVLEHAPRKSTIEVKVGKMQIALRDKEAQEIEVVEL
ncbi:MAG: ferrous iron transport protein A [Epsilonproteobacteria bacterium]|nr:ferrous iron transport protein A [Campylobacterota bacterium]